MCALQGLAQYDVAEEWTEAMERWCKTNAIGSLHGRCRVHRAEILRLRGSCDEAETEALAACEELRPYLRRELGMAAERARTDPTSQEETSTARSKPCWPLIDAGWDPQPGLALVRLAQGDVAAAAASIRDALERPLRVPSKELPPDTDLQRAPLLEAQVEIEIAAGDIDRARAAADELQLVAARFHSKALVAGATLARGRVRLAEGDAADGGTIVFRSRAALERGRRALRGGASHAWASPKPSAPAAASTRPTWSSRRPARSSNGSRAAQPTNALARQGRADEPSPALSVFRREGDYWSLVFEGRTVRVRDLKGMRYLARLLAHPGREFHVLDLVAAESGRLRTAESGQAAGLPRAALGDAGELLDARAKDAYRRRLAEIDDDIEQARALGDAERRRRRTPNATSSFESSRARSAWAVAIDEPHPRPSVLESP